MKHTIKSIIALFAILCLNGCSDFLDKYPKNELTEPTTFITYDNFKTFSWGFYDNFTGFPITASDYNPANAEKEIHTDNMIKASQGRQSAYAYQTKQIPATSGVWNFTFVRRVNLMLQNIDKSSMDQRSKDHWRSVGYFFRALRYYDMLANYGDIPWIDKVVGDSDEEIYLGPRTPRATVASNILADLKWAEEHIIPAGDGENTINIHVVRALMSRFCLFEGTWQKYHGISDGAVYLDECIRVSKELIAKYPTIIPSYEDVYTSLNLVSKPGIILAKQYALSKTTHSISRVIRTSAWYYDLTKDAVDSYLCTDGKPIGTSSKYDGDQTMYNQFRNRDRRLLYTVMPPYKVNGVTSSTAKTWSYHPDPIHREYIDSMVKISPANGKRFPVSNFAGNLCNMSPHFRNFGGGQGFIGSELGFYFWKYYNTHQENQNLGSDTENYPIFHIEEVMLNYAEAAWERNSFDQPLAELTINKLRTRANIAKMTVADITDSFDPARDQTVAPVLWEIRRERRVELMGDGFRFNDLKRWKKISYVLKKPLGAYVKNSDFGNKLKIEGGGTEGYVWYFDTPKGWLDKYYLEPIPSQQTLLNPSLLPNNPGWDE